MLLLTTHSLTDALDQQRVVAISKPTGLERRHTLAGCPRSSSSCCSHVRLGRPWGRFHLSVGRTPAAMSIASFSARCAGVSGERRQTCPKRECRRSDISVGRSKSPVFSLTYNNTRRIIIYFPSA